jgi:hypothetical protein
MRLQNTLREIAHGRLFWRRNTFGIRRQRRARPNGRRIFHRVHTRGQRRNLNGRNARGRRDRTWRNGGHGNAWFMRHWRWRRTRPERERGTANDKQKQKRDRDEFRFATRSRQPRNCGRFGLFGRGSWSFTNDVRRSQEGQRIDARSMRFRRQTRLRMVLRSAHSRRLGRVPRARAHRRSKCAQRGVSHLLRRRSRVRYFVYRVAPRRLQNTVSRPSYRGR